MKLLYVQQGIRVEYNKNESTDEYVYGIDDDNNVIQNITFSCPIKPSSAIKDYINNSKHTSIEHGFLFYSFAYQKSYCHYLTQTVPKLYNYLHSYPEHKLLIPRHTYNNLCRDILRLCNIDNERILIMENETIYRIKNYVSISNYHAPPSNFTQAHVHIYNEIRLRLYIAPNINPKRLIYMKRDSVPNELYGNDETGIKRQITNETQLICELEKLEFEIVSLGCKTIEEKHHLLRDAKIIITPLGANCMNLIFTNAPKYLLMLSNEQNFGSEYYANLSACLNSVNIQHHCYNFRSLYNNDTLNQWNSSFEVDISKLISDIQRCV
jgi:capsular polysaccharide biosynthesis protein